MKRIFLLFYFIFCIFFLSCEEKVEELKIAKGKQYLVLIACDRYKSKLPLENRVKNVLKLKNELLSRYHFDEYFELYDYHVTKENIENLFKKIILKTKRNDSVLFYFSGRNYFDESTAEGYWIQFDGKIEHDGQINYIAHKQVINFISKIKALHVCLISDCGFFANIIRKENKYINNVDLKENYTNKSRFLLVADDKAISTTGSNFTETLIESFNNNKETYLNIAVLYNKINKKFKHTPLIFGQLNNSKNVNNSSFLFFLRDKKVKPDSVSKVKIIDDKIATENNNPSSNKILTGLKKLNNINKSGIILIPFSASFLTGGIACLIYDLVVWMPGLNFNLFFGNEYSQYVNTYTIHLTTFITGISLSALGFIGFIVSIPLLSYKKKSKTWNKTFSFNFRIDKEFYLYISCKI